MSVLTAYAVNPQSITKKMKDLYLPRLDGDGPYNLVIDLSNSKTGPMKLVFDVSGCPGTCDSTECNNLFGKKCITLNQNWSKNLPIDLRSIRVKIQFHKCLRRGPRKDDTTNISSWILY